MLDLIARHKRFIKSFHVSLYEQEGEMLGNEVFESTETSVYDVLNSISEKTNFRAKGSLKRTSKIFTKQKMPDFMRSSENKDS